MKPDTATAKATIASPISAQSTTIISATVPASSLMKIVAIVAPAAAILSMSATTGAVAASRYALTPTRQASTHRNIKVGILMEAITKSKSILDLEYNWDDDGSSGYEAATLDRATSFVRKQFVASGESIDIPKILPGPDGSIDLHWKHDKYELLINIPAAKDETAEFYGDNRDNVKIKGALDVSGTNHELILWLMKQ